MNEIEIKKLPDHFFENPKAKSNINGVLRLGVGSQVDDLKCITFKLSSVDKVYNNIVVTLGDNVQGRIILHLHSDNVDFTVGDKVSGAFFFKFWSDAKAEIGSRTTSNSLEAWIDNNSELYIGEDCMIAHDVHIQCGDMHGIFDVATKCQINSVNNVTSIGDHVWVARRVVILKNIAINKGSIVGIGSIVTKDIPEFSLCVGNPAKVIKNGVSWTRSSVCTNDDIRKTINFLT